MLHEQDLWYEPMTRLKLRPGRLSAQHGQPRSVTVRPAPQDVTSNVAFQPLPFIQPFRAICRRPVNKEDDSPSESSEQSKPNQGTATYLRGNSSFISATIMCTAYMHKLYNVKTAFQDRANNTVNQENYKYVTSRHVSPSK